MKQFDIIVLGGGSAGLVAAKMARGLGKTVALIDTTRLGGECTWTGCIPSKTIIKSAQVAYEAAHATTYGFGQNRQLQPIHVLEHVRTVVQSVYQHLPPAALEQEGITVLEQTTPRFVDPYTLVVDEKKQLRAKKFIIATGSSPFIPPITGLATVPYLTNTTLFSLKQIPQSLIIVGGGPIGAEMGQAFARLGTKVTIIEMGTTMLGKEDPELALLLTKQFAAEEIEIVTHAQVTKVAKTDGQIAVTYEQNEHTTTLQAEQLLIATGRKPNIEGLALDKAGVDYTKRGITVTSKLQTSAKHIYACGDVVGPYQFSHMADYQAQIATYNACIPLLKKHVSYKDRIWVTFTDPELATLGMSEQEAKASCKNLKIYTISYANVDRAITDQSTHGLAKFFCKPDGTLLGCTILGSRAGEIIHELQCARSNGIKLHELQHLIHAYPAYSDVVKHAARKAYIDHVQSRWYIKLIKKIRDLFRPRK